MNGIANHSPTANTETADTVRKFAEYLKQVIAAAMDTPEASGLMDGMAGTLADDPREFELALRREGFEIIGGVYARTCERLDDFGPSVVCDGTVYRKVAPTRGRAMTVIGPVPFMRSRYRPDGSGRSICPVDALLGLAEGGVTPAAAETSLYLASQLPVRQAEEVWRRFTGAGPSASSITRLTEAEGARWAECEREELAAMREREPIPGQAASAHLSLDGVMLRMLAETEGDGSLPAGWREASTGAIELLDGNGEPMSCRYLGRLPEPGKRELKRQLSDELFRVTGQRPDLKVVAVADGAADNWTFLESLSPDCCLVDFWHACEHLKICADDAFGRESAKGLAWFERYREVLRESENGIGRTIEAIRHLVARGRGGEDLGRELRFFRKNRHRMNYRAASDAGYSIGSGTVESANKNLVQARMKRCGQRWGRPGGQAVLDFRALENSGRFDAACQALVRRRRAKAQVWTTPASAPMLALAA